MARDSGKLPWEQRDGETDKAYAAFRVFLEMPRGERGIEAAWRKWWDAQESNAGRKRPKEAPGMWGTWAFENDWKERVREWDREQDIKRVAILDEARRKRIEALAQKMEEDATLMAEASRAALSAAINGISAATQKDATPPTLGQAAQLLNAAARANQAATENLAKLAGVEDVLNALDSVEAGLRNDGNNLS